MSDEKLRTIDMLAVGGLFGSVIAVVYNLIVLIQNRRRSAQ